MSAHDVHVRTVAWVGAGLLAVVGLVIATTFVLLHVWALDPGADRAEIPSQVAAGAPRLQPAPQLDLARERARKQQVLQTAGWVDRAHGIAHIPIADAMAMLAHRAASEPGAAQ